MRGLGSARGGGDGGWAADGLWWPVVQAEAAALPRRCPQAAAKAAAAAKPVRLKGTLARMDPAQLIQHLEFNVDVRPLQDCSIVPPVRGRWEGGACMHNPHARWRGCWGVGGRCCCCCTAQPGQGGAGCVWACQGTPAAPVAARVPAAGQAAAGPALGAELPEAHGVDGAGPHGHHHGGVEAARGAGR